MCTHQVHARRRMKNTYFCGSWFFIFSWTDDFVADFLPCAWCLHIFIGVLGGRVLPEDPFRQQMGSPAPHRGFDGFWNFWNFLKILKISDFWKIFEFLIFWNLKKILKKFLCHVDDHHVCKYFIINMLYDIPNIIHINYRLIWWSYMKIQIYIDVGTPRYGLRSKGLTFVLFRFHILLPVFQNCWLWWIPNCW